MIFRTIWDLLLVILLTFAIAAASVSVIIDVWYDRKMKFIGNLLKAAGEELKRIGEAKKRNDQSDNT